MVLYCIRDMLDTWYFITHLHGSASVARTTKSMGKAKIWPPATLKPLNQSSPKFTYMIVVDIYHPAKFHPDRIRGFVSAHAQFHASNCLLGYLFFFGSSNRLQPRRRTDFDAKYIKWRGYAQGCAFLVSQNQKLSFTHHFCSKDRHFWARFDET